MIAYITIVSDMIALSLRPSCSRESNIVVNYLFVVKNEAPQCANKLINYFDLLITRYFGSLTIPDNEMRSF